MEGRSLGLAGDIIPRMQQRVVDQRCEERHEGVVERAMLTFRQQDHLVPVLNISARGTMIETDITPRIGETALIQSEKCTRVHAFVRWIRGGRIGSISATRSSWDFNLMLHQKIAADQGVEPRRRELRVGISAGISLRQLGHTAVEARLVNISSHGFMADSEARIAAGSRVWLTLPGCGRVNALVIWARNGRLGGEFADPVDPLQIFQAAGPENR